MFLFYLKKNFCDGWDNMLSLVLPNLLILIFGIGLYFLIGFLIEPLPALGIAVQVAGILLVVVAIFAFGEGAARIAGFKAVSFRDYLAAFKSPALWKDAILFGVVAGLVVMLALLGIPFYLSQGGMLGVFLAAVLFWFLLVCVLALQWFLPIRSLMGNSFKKCLKKSFIIFFDNPGFSCGVFIYTLFLTALSVFMFFILPGFSGLLLAQTNALRLRLYKYDWYEQNPELTPKERRHVPWDELVAEDHDMLGPRTLKSFIFPWK